MSLLYNITRVYTSTIGTGTLTLGDAVSGHLTFAQAGVQNGDVVSYSIVEEANVEVGRGTYNSVYNTLSRDTVYNSTNSGAKINLAGNAQVMITAIKQDFDHDELVNFVADEHIPHSTLDVLAGAGLSGGGNLASDVTLSIDLSHSFAWTGGHTFSAGVSFLSGVNIGASDYIGAGNLNVEGDLTIGGDTVFSGSVLYDSFLATTGGIHIGGISDPDADGNYTGSLIVEGYSQLVGPIIAQDVLRVTRYISTLGGLSIGSDADAGTGNLFVANNASIEGTLQVDSHTLLEGGLRVGSTGETLAGYLSVESRIGVGILFPEYKLHILGGRIKVDRDSADNATILDSTTPVLGSSFGYQQYLLGASALPSKQVAIRAGSSGTYGSNPYLSFLVANTEWMRITNTGKIGLGTTTPASKLSITSSTYRDFIRLTNPFINTVWDITPNSAGSGGALEFYSSILGKSVMTLLGQEGNVGIGTTPLNHRLHVLGDAYIEDSTLAQLIFSRSAKISTEMGALNLAPASDLSFAPLGQAVILGNQSRIGSQEFASGRTGWNVSYAGTAEFRQVRTDEIVAKNLLSEQSQAIAGSQLITKGAAPLAQTFIVPEPSQVATLVVRGFVKYSSYAVFANGDYVRIRVLERINNQTYSSDCWGTVALAANGINSAANEQTYQFTRSSGTQNILRAGNMPAGTVVEKGTLVLDYGEEGSGYIESTALG